MTITFPSREFDEAVAAACHGSISDDDARALNRLLRQNTTALDEYILQVEIHSRLASQPDLFANEELDFSESIEPKGLDTGALKMGPVQAPRFFATTRKLAGFAALAACLMVSLVGLWNVYFQNPIVKTGMTSKAVAMLNLVVDAKWASGFEIPRAGASLEPGQLAFKSGFVQVVFYSGARVTIQGPAEFNLESQNQISLAQGRLVAEVPPQAQGFLVRTGQATVRDLGTSFGLEVKDQQTALHVFKGSVELQTSVNGVQEELLEGAGALLEASRPPQYISARPAAFASLFDVQDRSTAEDVERFSRWRESSERLNSDPALLLHLDFQSDTAPEWQLANSGNQRAAAPDATVVGCQWSDGRWPGKRALEFQSMNDRVRLSVPGEFDSLTLVVWARVLGLDRKINSLFMSDGFVSGTVHWSIRDDGVLGLTVIGRRPGQFQIIASPPVIGLDKFGMWLCLAVVIDREEEVVTHYVNGFSVGSKPLRIETPFHIGPAELGNWNASGFPGDDPFLIRNFSGAMDEFLLFSRALNADEVHTIYSEGHPQMSLSPNTNQIRP
jgi:hypothetical protein